MRQFEREEAGVLAKLLAKQGLQALDPLAALDAFLPRALREVRAPRHFLQQPHSLPALDCPQFSNNTWHL